MSTSQDLKSSLEHNKGLAKEKVKYVRMKNLRAFQGGRKKEGEKYERKT